MDNLRENNIVNIAGKAITDFQYSHEVYGEKYYITTIEIERVSGLADQIQVIVSERLVDTSQKIMGFDVATSGSFRSYNKHDESGAHLILHVFADSMHFLDEMKSEYIDNSIELYGYVCKEVKYRKTPLGREIADLLLAVNRPYGKSDYIPCICWGRNARYVDTLKIGERVSLCGRIQSREYLKRISDTESETRTAYEVSVSKIEVMEGNKNENSN